ncbi:class I SAM-dependent methyltransferase [uncultured Pseudodesulfovibrio sp.]|uniref:class I SAM-dependent DNA methyltransferase n=1 Tax=uncultured Pseudodesulfovibrio sp. TaxID=2035858 RepID=UPI0029C676E5|nr:class I SAM-dependent methyltransferase [uncultured Pseudodesulfovibrio sp.]
MTTNTKVRRAFTGDHVQQYDMKSQKANWLDPEIVFGLAYRDTAPGETILDVGIGTGLASVLFHKAGLRVKGMDFSSEMLGICRQKSFASELAEHDVSVSPYPFADESVHHAVCTGVMHLFSDLDVIFSEVSRIMKKGGVFAFVVAHQDDGDSGERPFHGRTCRPGVTFHFHSPSSLNRLGERCGFEPVRSLRFTSASIGRREMEYRACVVRKV